MKRSLFIFGYLSDADVEWLASVADRRSFSTDMVMIEHGKPSDYLMIILDGSAAVEAKGRRVATVSEGDILGEVSFFDSRPPSATVVAITPTNVLAIPFSTLRDQLGANPEFASRLYYSLGVLLSQRLRETLGSEIDDADEIDPDVMEQIGLAGRRLELFFERATRVL